MLKYFLNPENFYELQKCIPVVDFNFQSNIIIFLVVFTCSFLFFFSFERYDFQFLVFTFLPLGDDVKRAL